MHRITRIIKRNVAKKLFAGRINADTPKHLAAKYYDTMAIYYENKKGCFRRSLDSAAAIFHEDKLMRPVLLEIVNDHVPFIRESDCFHNFFKFFDGNKWFIGQILDALPCFVERYYFDEGNEFTSKKEAKQQLDIAKKYLISINKWNCGCIARNNSVVII